MTLKKVANVKSERLFHKASYLFLSIIHLRVIERRWNYWKTGIHEIENFQNHGCIVGKQWSFHPYCWSLSNMSAMVSVLKYPWYIFFMEEQRVCPAASSYL